MINLLVHSDITCWGLTYVTFAYNLARTSSTECLYVKGYAVTLSEISRYKVNKVNRIMHKNSWSYILSPWFNLANTSPTECLSERDEQWSWNKFLGQGHIREHAKYHFQSIYTHTHTMYYISGSYFTWTAFGLMVCSDLEPRF